MDYFVWDMSPEIVRLGSFGPRYYGLLFALGFLVTYKLMEKMWIEDNHDVKNLSSLLLHVMLGTIIGARIGHVLFYEPMNYLSRPWEILMVWKGGLASHGGTLGVVIAVWIYCKRYKSPSYGYLADKIGTIVPFAAGCIRTGNFFNSEILGKPATVPWAVVFKRVDDIPRHPAMLYEAAVYFAIFAIMMWRHSRYGKQLRPGSQIGLMLILVFTSRVALEPFKLNQVAFEQGMLFNMGQLLSVPFVLFGIILFKGYHRKEGQ